METSQATDLGNKTYDFKGLIEAIRDAQRKPLEIMKVHQGTTQTKISAFGKVTAAVEAVKTAAAELAASNSTISTTVAGKGFTATAGDDAVASVYQIDVLDLATSQTLKSNSIASRTDPIGKGGTVVITLANGKLANIDVKGDTSLNGITKAINGSDSGLRASVVNNGAGASYLLLSSTETGTQVAVAKIEVTGNPDLARHLDFDAANAAASKLSIATAATNAEVVINGITVTSGSNTVDTAIDGVVLSLTEKTTLGTPSTLTLARNNAGVSKAAFAFVSAYNAAQSMLAELTVYTPGAGSQGALFADGTARRVQSGMANALHGISGEGSLRSLSKLGVTADAKTGLLTLNQGELTKALFADPVSVASLFSGKNGIGVQFDRAMNTILGDGQKITGSLPSTVATLQSLAKNQEKSYAALERSSNAQIDTLNAQFNALAGILSRIDATKAALKAQFENTN